MSWPTLGNFGRKSPPEVVMLARGYLDESLTNNPKQLFYVKGVPPSLAKSLLRGWPLVRATDRQNESPTMRTMIALAEAHGGTLGGYVIPIESGRSDSRIAFDTLFIPTESHARALKAKYQPDEFMEWGNPRGWRLWWD